MKPKFIDAYMDVAERFGKLSTARRLNVGSIIVKDNRIISIGYNGMPSGWDNNCEDSVMWKDGVQLTQPVLKSKPEVLHAESNAITKLAKGTQSSIGSTVYVTLMPCFDCAKLMIQSGIKRVVYLEEYRLTNGVDLLKKAGIEVCHLVK